MGYRHLLPFPRPTYVDPICGAVFGAVLGTAEEGGHEALLEHRKECDAR